MCVHPRQGHMIELTLFLVTDYATNTTPQPPKCLILGSLFVAEMFGLFINVLIYVFGPWTRNQFYV